MNLSTIKRVLQHGTGYQTDAAVAEIERRNRYWFDHPDDFTCEVVIRQDHIGGQIGGFIPGLVGPIGAFGSMPVHTMGVVDHGSLTISGPIVTVWGERHTWQWDLRVAQVVYDDQGGKVEMRLPNQKVTIIQGPVSPAIVGAAMRYTK